MELPVIGRLSQSGNRAKKALSIAVVLLLSFHLAAWAQGSSSDGKGSKGQASDGSKSDTSGNSKGQGGQSAGGQGGGGQEGGNSSKSYRVEIDMLAYDAAEKIAAQISSNIGRGKGKFIVYDEHTFLALQLYEAYAAGISVFESAFRLVERNQSKALEPGVAAAQTIVSTLAALRSSTEFGTQTVNLNADALVAQLSFQLPGRIVVPKVLLENPGTTDDLGLGSWKSTETENGCADLTKTVPWQLACILAQRYQAVGKPGFAEIDKLFQSFLGLLVNVNVSGSASTGPPKAKGSTDGSDDGNENGSGPSNAQSDKPKQGSQDSNAPAAQSPMMFSLVSGRRLEYELKAGCSSNAPGEKNHLLVLETTAAGGSYRIRHNFWVEVFWTTPTPSFNGGAVVTYAVINPCDSTIETADVFRYMINYGKFKDTKPEKSGSNLTHARSSTSTNNTGEKVGSKEGQNPDNK